VASVGILGGTFNPPHVGHLVCAQEARAQLGLDRVLLMPVNRPPHKEAVGDPGAGERVAMCRLAASGADWLDVSTLEAERGGASYTVDTLRALTAHAPQDDLTFIVGGDMAHSFASWREPEAILGLATLAVAERESVDREQIAARLAPFSAAARADAVRFFDMPRLDISSSELRRRVAAGAPIRYLVPDAVADHIAGQRLYGVPGPDRGAR
jgi:nicotinate-nucleotide adenylyltransferase